ncbi:MAG: alginate lyase family protein [Candidatus Sulfotelmatobacter sp.]
MTKPSLGNRLSRLAAMDRRELIDRFRQYFTARADLLWYSGGRDLGAGLRGGPTPVEGRFFFQPSEVQGLCSALKQVFPREADDIVCRAQKICGHDFDLLGYENLVYGAEIDWHLDVAHGRRGPRKAWFKINYLDFGEVGDAKITWELNRHQHFVTLAKAYSLTGDKKFASEVFAQWQHWHKQNPYPMGMNWASSLEAAFRSLSWIWTYFLLRDSSLFTPDLRSQWHGALNLSGRHIETYLSTYFSPNTHLLGEALALFFLGTLFPNFSSASRWQRRGWEILENEAARQVRNDGFYFEQSTYYHVYALDIFLHARILAALNGVQISPRFDEILQRMLNALLLFSRAGIPPMIGDDDGGRLFDSRRNWPEHMLDPLATGAVLYRRGDLKAGAGAPREETLWLFGSQGLAGFAALPAIPAAACSTALVDSGLYLMEDETAGQQLLIEAGPLGSGNGGHAHAAALSVALIRKGRSLLDDSGTFEYVGDSGERARLRGTGAHNTMQIDGRDQADSAGPFAWKNPPRVKVEQWITGRCFDLFQASHNGYSRLSSPVIHRRWVFHMKQGFWLIHDLAEGRGSHRLDIAWHIGPTLSPDASKYLFKNELGRLAVLAAEGHGWSETLRHEYRAPVYGLREQAPVVHYQTLTELPAAFATLVIAGGNASAPGRFETIDGSSAAAVCGYRYSDAQQKNIVFFAHHSGPWELGVWASDADFLCWSFDREREQYMLILCNGSYVNAGGRRILNCDGRVSYAEILSSSMKVDLFSSDPERVVPPQPLDQVWADGELIVPGNDPAGMSV